MLELLPFPKGLVQARSRTVSMVNIVHPCRVNLFEKPCPRLWTNLGIAVEIIEK